MIVEIVYSNKSILPYGILDCALLNINNAIEPKKMLENDAACFSRVFYRTFSEIASVENHPLILNKMEKAKEYLKFHVLDNYKFISIQYGDVMNNVFLISDNYNDDIYFRLVLEDGWGKELPTPRKLSHYLKIGYPFEGNETDYVQDAARCLLLWMQSATKVKLM